MRRLPAVIALLTLLPCLAHADDYRPLEGTPPDHVPTESQFTSICFPRVTHGEVGNYEVPLARQRAVADAWTGALRESAARIPGTRFAAELLFSAAWPYRHQVPDDARLRSHMADALDAARADDPLHAIIAVRLGAFELAKGNVPRAETLLATLEGWRAPVVPVDLDEVELWRWHAFQKIWSNEFPRFEAGVLVALGRVAEAAAILEARAQASVDTQADERGRRFQAAARLYAQAGDPAAAARLSARAIEHTDNQADQETWRLWRLYAGHEMLDRFGVPGPTGRWAGAAFESDARVLLDGLDGEASPRAMAAYGVIGSHAHFARQDGFALEVYLHALDNPFLLDAARTRPDLLSNATIGVMAAIGLGRFDDAGRILDLVVDLGAVDPSMADQLRALIQERRADAKEEDARRRRAEETEREAPDDERSQSDDGEGSGHVGIRPPREDGPAWDETYGDEPEEGRSWPWVALTAGLVLLVLAATRTVRRRARR